MRKIREFRCGDDHITEHYVYDDVDTHPCKVCNKLAKRIISAVRCKLDPLSGDFPGATIKWIKEKEQASKPKDS